MTANTVRFKTSGAALTYANQLGVAQVSIWESREQLVNSLEISEEEATPQPDGSILLAPEKTEEDVEDGCYCFKELDPRASSAKQNGSSNRKQDK